MKKFKLFAFIAIIATMLFAGITGVSASTSIPDAFTSDNYKIIEYLDNFRVIVKTADNGKYYIYCINMEATYDKGVTFTKQSTVNPGFIYILNNKPNTGDKDKDFYITQMAVWYYEDYLNQNNNNLETAVKKYIVAHKDTNDVCKKIIELLNGAQTYVQQTGGLSLGKENISFTEKDGYFVSSVIPVTTRNLTGNLKYSLTNAPKGSLVVKSGNGVKVKVPVDKIDEGKQLKLSLNVTGTYNKQEAYYYYHSSKYQKILFQDALDRTITIQDSVNMIIRNYPDDYEVQISKTDVTQSKEVPGATLTVKDSNGNLVSTWVSTDKPNKLTLSVGEYSLNETIAPKGYRLSSTTIRFKVDEDGKVYVKNDKNNYVLVDRVVMINELLDVVSFAKKDSKTDAYLANAKMVIKDEKGNVVHEFISKDSVYQYQLNVGKYTLSEVEAPTGYILSNEVINFEILNDGTLRVKNNNSGEYADSAIIVFYNTPEDKKEVPVPATGSSATFLILSGAALLIGGIACVKKTIKEC